MPVTFYSAEEVSALRTQCLDLERKLQASESLRPQWAMGYTTDSMAAQCASNALQQIWDSLGVTNQTDAMLKLEKLKAWAI